MRLGDRVNEHVLAREAADDAGAGGRADRPDEPEEQHIGEVDDVGPPVASEPCGKLGDFLPLVAEFAFQRRNGERPKIGRPRAAGSR